MDYHADAGEEREPMIELTPKKFASKDKTGRIRHIEQIQDPFLSPSIAEPTPEQLADQYLAEVAQIYQIDTAMLKDLGAFVPGAPTTKKAQLHRSGVKDIAGSIIVNYSQSYRGIPVWRADFSVHIAPNPMRVTSSTSAIHESISLGNDPEEVARIYQEKLKPGALSKFLGLKKGKGISQINGMRLVIYQYDPDQRTEIKEAPHQGKVVTYESPAPTLPLPPLPKVIEAEIHYVVAEVLFDLDWPEWKDLHWLALIEPVSGAVLYLRALVSSASGMIFRMDPISLSGDSTLTPAANEALLNPLRTNIVLDDLVAGIPQSLQGTQVDIEEMPTWCGPPVVDEPTTDAPFAFDYGAKTTDFTAVNAYYHVNWIFNLMKGMGFDLSTYFDGTTFPVPVDWWARGAVVNAHCPGNEAGDGIGHFCFGAAQDGENVGIADDIRVVIHEFGHALLWDNVSSANFGFAHSAGDALGAILMDPTSIAPDRFLTFPWPQTGTGPLDRRHDRSVSAGWGWFGTMYDTQYSGEQILSTTLFRLYCSVGGDSPYPADRAWASRYVSYLIFKAIGLLTSVTDDPEVFVTALKNADLTTSLFEGHPGGALHKVIRWAFEKQGLFHPDAFPHHGAPYVAKEGDPPEVDVYIDDGRNGEYQYLYAFWESQDMWVRRNPDGGTTHQDPAVGKTNYMYVRVKNRGTKSATDVVVKAYHCNPGTGLVWPDDWSPMDTPMLPALGPVPSGGSVVVGPFEWTPEVYGHECLLAIASATGDDGNDTTVLSPVPHSRFVPFDNNIGQRNVHPVYVLDWEKIPAYFKKIPFKVVNPLTKAVKVELVPVLPKELMKKKYWILFTNPGGNKFELGPRATKKIVLSLVNKPMIPSRRPWGPASVPSKPGILTAEELLEGDSLNVEEGYRAVRRPLKIRIVTLMNGQNVGGMTYVLQQKGSIVPPKEGRSEITAVPVPFEEEPEMRSLFEGLIKNPEVKKVRLKKVNLDIEFEE